MGMGLLQLPDDLAKRRQQWLWDDFFYYTDTQLWTKAVTGSGGVAIGGGPATQLSLTSGTTLNSEAAVASTNAFWEFLSNKPLIMEARINYQEANTNNGGLFIGFSSGFGGGAGAVLQATTGVPNTSQSAAGFYVAQGSTAINVLTSVGSTQTLTVTDGVIGTTADQVFRVEVMVVGTNVEVDFLMGVADNTGGFSGPSTTGGIYPTGFEQLRETASGFNKPIKHRVAYAGAAAMKAGVLLKCFSTTGETCLVDYIGALSLR